MLCGRKFRYPAEVASSIIQEIESISDLVVASRSIDVVQADPYDNMILERALAGKVDYIVSGDSHLLDLGEFEGIRIITPAQMLEAWNNDKKPTPGPPRLSRRFLCLLATCDSSSTTPLEMPVGSRQFW